MPWDPDDVPRSPFLRYVVASACSERWPQRPFRRRAKANIRVGSVETDRTVDLHGHWTHTPTHCRSSTLMRSSSLLIQATLVLLTVSLASAQTMAVLQGRVRRSIRRGRSWRVGRGAQFRHRVHQHDLERRPRPLSRAGHPGRRVSSHGRGSRIQIRAHRRADVRGRPHLGTRLSADGRHPARSGSGPRGTAAARSGDERRRTRRDGDDRPGNPAQRPPLHRSRIAGARIGGAVANRLLEPRRSAAPARWRSIPPATAKKRSPTSSTA